MTLILTGAPDQEAEGMDGQQNKVAPGQAPPVVSPHCAKCGVPVERFTIDPISSPYYLGIQATCHGKTSGIRVPHDEVLAKRLKAVIWMFRE